MPSSLESDVLIAPSLLAADFSRLGREVSRVTRGGADWLHLDVMDGHFVPNLSFGPDVVKALRPETRITFDVHLMCQKPSVLLEPFAKAGADSITVHAELEPNTLQNLIWQIRALGKKVGLAINPPTQFSVIEPFLSNIDLLLIMTVIPGFGGQAFMEETLAKIRKAAQYRAAHGHAYHIQVDGGIDTRTASLCAEQGAEIFVSGSHLFKQPQMGPAIRRLRAAVLRGCRSKELKLDACQAPS